MVCCLLAGSLSAAQKQLSLTSPDGKLKATINVGEKLTYSVLYDGKEVLDKALITYFQAPHSFTGEDVAEFAVHASPYIKGRLLELLCEHGAVAAKRGEFSQRAFLNGKMDLVEAQGLCDLIASGNKAAHKLAMDSLDGKLSARLEEIKKRLSELLAQIEVRLDDVDEEMTPLSDKFVEDEINGVLGHIKALADTFSVGKYIKDGLKTAIVGAPKRLHAVLTDWCTGCALCVIPCPVDCIEMRPAPFQWTRERAHQARERYHAKLEREKNREAHRNARLAQESSAEKKKALLVSILAQVKKNQ